MGLNPDIYHIQWRVQTKSANLLSQEAISQPLNQYWACLYSFLCIFHSKFKYDNECLNLEICWQKLCTIGGSNPRRLFSFYASGNAGHIRAQWLLMTCEHDVMSTARQVRFLLNGQTSEHIAPCTHAFITLRNERHAWSDQNSLTEIGRQ